MTPATVLVADDDPSLRFVISQALAQEGYTVRATDTPDALMRWIRAGEGDVVVSDVYMGDRNIFDDLPEFRRLRPDLPILVISAQNSLMTAADAERHGAIDYLPKPFDISDLSEKVARALAGARLADRIGTRPIRDQSQALPLIGRSDAMQAVFRALSRWRGITDPVLITGPPGSGKAAAANALHALSETAGAYVEAYPDALIDRDTRCEVLQRAHSGTLVLRRLDLASQDGLRAIMSHCLSPALNGDMRLVATLSPPREHTSLMSAAMDALGVLRLEMPPLSARGADASLLAEHFLRQRGTETGQARRFDPAALRLLELRAPRWEVRTLHDVVIRLFHATSHRVISASDVRAELSRTEPDAETSQSTLEDGFRILLEQHALPSLLALGDDETSNLHSDCLTAFESALLGLALDVTDGNKLKAAQKLGMNRNTLRARLRTVGILDS